MILGSHSVKVTSQSSSGQWPSTGDIHAAEAASGYSPDPSPKMQKGHKLIQYKRCILCVSSRHLDACDSLQYHMCGIAIEPHAIYIYIYTHKYIYKCTKRSISMI